MKKLIGIFAMLLITLSILGQEFHYYGGINEWNHYLNNDVNLERGNMGEQPVKDREGNNVINYSYYWFKTKDEVKYVLAYRRGQGTLGTHELTAENNYRHEKELMLHRWIDKDSIWIEASNVVQTDYRTASTGFNQHGEKFTSYQNMSHIIYKGIIKGFSYGSEDIEDNGDVIMKIVNERISTDEIGNVKDFYYNSVRLRPNGDGTYMATQIATQE